MMKAEGWVIKGSKVNQSDKIAKLCKPGPLCPIRVWMTLAASVDSWGMMRGNKWTLKAKLGENDDHHGPDEFAEAIEEGIEVKLIARWWNKGIPWLYVVGHDEEHKTKFRAKYPVSPRPPLEILNQGGDLGDIMSLQDRSKIDPSPKLDRSKIDPRSSTGKGKLETGKGKLEKRGGVGEGDDHHSAILAHQESHSLLSAYSDEQRRVIQIALDEVASTRQRGIIADTVRCSILRKLARYPATVVEQATRTYIEKGCAKEGKDEKYWLGIARGIWKRERKDEQERERESNADRQNEWIHESRKFHRRELELMACDVQEGLERKVSDPEKLALVKTAMRERPAWNWPEGLG